MGTRLKLPPDNVSDWSRVGVQVYDDDSIKSVITGSSRPREIFKWLDTNTEGQYYTNSFARYIVVSFELQSDALMFALTWTGGRIDF